MQAITPQIPQKNKNNEKPYSLFLNLEYAPYIFIGATIKFMINKKMYILF